MFTFKILILVALTTSIGGSRTSAPLIKNVYRDGEHSEGPHWVPEENALYWVDIFAQKVNRLDVNTGNVTTKEIGYGPVSLVVAVKDNPKLVVVTVRSEVYLLPWDSPPNDRSLTFLSAVDFGHPDNRINDGKVDAKGRLWFGTMGKEENNDVEKDQGTLYMLDQNNYANPAVKVKPVSISNGIAWTADSKFMFYIDTPTRNIDVFDYDVERGNIYNRRTLFSFQANNVTGSPDGMTIDTDGNLWVACFNGGKVIKIDSRAGKLLEHHRLPADKVTSVMFGGNDLSTLFVTTSNVGLNAIEKSKQPEAGSVFAIEGTGAKGRPENKFVFPDVQRFLK